MKTKESAAGGRGEEASANTLPMSGGPRVFDGGPIPGNSMRLPLSEDLRWGMESARNGSLKLALYFQSKVYNEGECQFGVRIVDLDKRGSHR